ncbi:MAG: ARMT1-like domain-containing protein [Candidatus Caldatribacteriota bacterium]|nr:ARMT1-like domain-containing protein [Candidatus Caldatribacteriota bacterium]
MRTHLNCASCIIDDLCGALQLVPLEEKIKKEILRESFQFLAREFSTEKIPSYFITEVHRILKKISGIEIPFKERRDKCNQLGIEMAEKITLEAEGLEEFEKFSFLVNWAIASNHLDFRTVGTGYGFQMAEIIEELRGCVSEGLKIDQRAVIFQKAKNSSEILYIHDNVGEIAFDKLLIKELRRYGASVTSALRGGPITSDATIEDGETVGLQEVASKIILAGPDTLGISLNEMSNQLKRGLHTADLIIAKGQANYYALTEYKSKVPGKIACLFRTKCEIVSNDLGETGKINVAILL